MSNRERLDRSTRGGASGIRYSRYSSDAESQTDDNDDKSDSDRRSDSSSEEADVAGRLQPQKSLGLAGTWRV